MVVGGAAAVEVMAGDVEVLESHGFDLGADIMTIGGGAEAFVVYGGVVETVMRSVCERGQGVDIDGCSIGVFGSCTELLRVEG